MQRGVRDVLLQGEPSLCCLASAGRIAHLQVIAALTVVFRKRLDQSKSPSSKCVCEVCMFCLSMKDSGIEVPNVAFRLPCAMSCYNDHWKLSNSA